jgi:hypothetical protein
MLFVKQIYHMEHVFDLDINKWKMNLTRMLTLVRFVYSSIHSF